MIVFQVWDVYANLKDSEHDTREQAEARVERLVEPQGYDDLGRVLVGLDPRDLEIRAVEY